MLLVRPFHVNDHFLFVQRLHGLFDLFEENLWYPATQCVDRVQELCLEWVEQRLEYVVFKGKLKRSKIYHKLGCV